MTNELKSLVHCYYFACICLSAPAPFLPKESELHGQAESITGFMLGYLLLVQTVFTPLWGKLLVPLGARRLLIWGMLISGIMTALFGCIEFVPREKTILYTTVGFLIGTLLSCASSAVYTTVFVLITDLFPDDNTLALSLTGALGGVGMMSGPAIGGGLYAVGGFWVVFVGIGGVMMLLSIFMFLFFKEHNTCHEIEKPTVMPYRKLFLNSRMIISVLICFYSAAKWSAIDPILEPHLRNTFGMHQTQSAMVFLLLSGAYVIATPIAGKTVGQPYCIDSMLVMIIGLSVSMCAFLFAGPSSLLPVAFRFEDLWVLLLCLSVMGVTNCMLYVPAQDIIFKIDHLDLPTKMDKTAVRGLLSGVWNSAYSLGMFSGMTLSGTLEQYFGWAWTMTVYAIGCLFFIIIIFSIRIQEASQGCCLNYMHPESKDEDGERKKLLE